jgi:uncharacterized protein YjdB
MDMNSIRSVRGRVPVFILLGIVALSAACAGHDVTSPVLDASLSINSGGQTVFVVQQTLPLTATVRDSSGATLTGQTVTWASSDTTVASVSKSGLVSGRSPGAVTITAACDGTKATVLLTVVAPIAVVSVNLATPGTVAVGGSMQVYATAVATNGDTTTGLPVTWSSSNTSLATVAPFNTFIANVSAIAAGNVSITATVAGVSGSNTVTAVPLSAVASVKLSPGTVTFVAGALGFGAGTQMVVFATDAAENPVLGVPVAWSISDTSAATISPTGLITPNAAVFYGSMATATVTATAAGFSVSIPVFVCPAVASIAVSTTAIDLSVGQSITLVATVLDVHGNPERVPLSSEIVFPNGRVVTTQRVGLDSVLVTGVSPGTASLDFFYGTVQSPTVAITVGGAASSAARDDRLSAHDRGRGQLRLAPGSSRRPARG